MMNKTKEQLIADLENKDRAILDQAYHIQKLLENIEELNNKLNNVPKCSSCPHQMKATNTAEEHAERIEKLQKQINELISERNSYKDKFYNANSKADNLNEKLQAAYQETVYARQQLNDYRANNPFRSGLFQMIDLLSLMKKDIKLGEEINK